jgi:hypothetical protein
MNTIKFFFFLALSLILFQKVEAADRKLTFEPIYGMETALVRYPEPARYVTRGTYGARLLYGLTLLSAEVEYTEANSRKDYPSSSQKVFDRSQRASLGVRSTIPLGSYFGFYMRLGGRASQGTSEVTTLGVTEKIDNPLRVDPYGGAGLQLAFSQFFALNAGATMIRNADNQYDAQYTLGLTAHLGKY